MARHKLIENLTVADGLQRRGEKESARTTEGKGHDGHMNSLALLQVMTNIVITFYTVYREREKACLTSTLDDGSVFLASECPEQSLWQNSEVSIHATPIHP